MLVLFMLTLTGVIFPLTVGSEFVVNGDFERPIDSDWFCPKCNLERSTDAYEGSYSALITARAATWDNLMQLITPSPGRSYSVTAAIKLQDAPTGSDEIRIRLRYTFSNGSRKTATYAVLPRLTVDDGWQEISAIFTLLNGDVTEFRLHFEASSVDTSYLVDAVSMTELADDTAWRDVAEEQIQQIRQSQLNLQVHVSEEYDTNKVQITLDQVRPSFGFGSSVNENYIRGGNEPIYDLYINYFTHTFWTATPEWNMDWKNMEPTMGQLETERLDACMEALQAHGIRPQGTIIVPANPNCLPAWVKALDGAQLTSSMSSRIQYMAERYAQTISHLSVSHDALHYNYIPETTGNDDILKELFEEAHLYNPDVTLQLSDTQVLVDGLYLQALVNQVEALLSEGVSIGALAAKVTVGADDVIHPHVIKAQLDKIGDIGIPVWITDLKIDRADVHERAEAYTDLLRVFFSHPAVAGVMLYGFFDQVKCGQNAALVEGRNFQLNAAGEAVRDLWSSWRTRQQIQPTTHSLESFSTAAYQGDYVVRMQYDGQVVKEINFTVGTDDVAQEVHVVPQNELVRNGDMELGDSGWVCKKCTLTVTSDSYRGSNSLFISDRSTMWASVQQSVPARRGGRYHISAHIKLDNLLQGALYHELQLKLKSRLANGKTKYATIATLPYLRPEVGWQKIGGAVLVENYESEIVESVITFDLEPTISYYLDEVRLREIEARDWRREANERIEQSRQSDFTVKLKVSEEFDVDKVDIQIKLAKHRFGFGSSIRERYLSNTNSFYEPYRQYFFDTFWSSSLERSLRWDYMEPTEGETNYDELEAALKILNNMSIPVLGSSLFWGKVSKYPNWMNNKSPTQAAASINSRVDDIFQKYGNRFDKLILNKEQLLFDFFEEKTMNADTYTSMVKRAHQYSTGSEIYLSEKNILKHGYLTQALVGLAQRLADQGAAVSGVGAQGFFDGNTVDDPQIIAKRIEILQEAGLPIWITELYVNLASPEQTADAYEDLLRLFFSLEAVEGVMLYDFSDLTRSPANSALVTGADCMETEVGRRIKQLWESEWHSEFNITPRSHSLQTLSLRGFHGDYQINMYHNGELINTEHFTLSPVLPLRAPINVAVVPSEEVVVDGDFEGEGSLVTWGCLRCRLELTEDSYAGQFSAKVTQRSGSRAYIHQILDVDPTASYHISAFVKVLNLPAGKSFDAFNMRTVVQQSDGSYTGGVLAILPYLEPAHGWREITAAVKFDYPGAIMITLLLEAADVRVDFAVDEVRVRPLEGKADWKTEANERIEEIRKNNITLRMTVSEEFDINNVEVEVKLKKHSFGFGSVVDAKDIGEERSSHREFRDYFLTNFWWGSFFRDFTWRNMEATRDQPSQQYLEDALNIMGENNVKAHGHCLASESSNELPSWLPGLSGTEIMQELDDRISHVINGIGDRFDQLVVNADRFHSLLLEEAAETMNATAWLFDYVHRLSPNQPLFLSDYDILDKSKYTQATINFIREMKRDGIKISGLAVEAPFSNSEDIDIDLLCKRLEILEDAEVPIWVTEFAVARDDVTSRASMFEDLLTLFFSAPNVGGVILKGFWDRERISSNEALAEGTDFVENEVGRRMRHLWDRQWTTREVIRPQTHGHQAYDLRGFYGDYDIIMRHNGDVIKQQSFTLSPGETLDLYVDVYPQSELMKNPGFEAPLSDSSARCICCEMTTVTESYKGEYAVLITNRTDDWHTYAPEVQAVGGSKYYVSMMVKLYNRIDGIPYHDVSLSVKVDEVVKGEKLTEYKYVATLPYVTVDDGWVKVAGAFSLDTYTAGQEVIATPLIYVDKPQVSFYLDEYAMHEIIHHDDWREKANERIITHRTNKLSIGVKISDSYNPQDIRIEVELKRHAFPFGSAVTANTMRSSNPLSQIYRDHFYDNYWFGVFQNAFKWHLLEKKRNFFNWARVDGALAALDSHNISTRGHCMFWGHGELNIPRWLFNMDEEGVRSEIERRITQAATRYKGRFAHYDVNNELLHGNFYENATGDYDITPKMFEMIHAIDPDVELFINDFNILSTGASTQASINQALQYKARNTPIHGLGAQSHFRSSAVVDPDLVYKRLDMLEEAGLPVWVTELDVNMDDYSDCAQAYEDLLRTMFSHPIVEGIIMWGFWDEDHLFPFCPHVVGENLTLTDSGRAIQRLWREEWHTNVTIEPRSREPELHIFDAFHGTYDMKVFYQDDLIRTDTFEVHKGQNECKTIML